ncbi:VirB8/TrbF family protein [Prauserella endophytica]|uniref:Bacterial virulence protein VirB8 domain-containing protein n=1 Tax=Prauserella endophytica TaxID=1592324 RepID=A0ABY2S583_9PSEU|nr:VirB8/TrbF family protein [Prauserella endophytica]TKG71094.1 hypothetical protein FCN18_13320 [Prauserella endophytica]
MRITIADRKPSPKPRSTVDDKPEDEDEAGTTDDTPPTEEDPPERRSRRPKPRLLLAVLAVAALLGAGGYLGARFAAHQAAETARTEALAAAKRYATDLSSYDFNDLQGNFSAVEAGATGRFAEQYRQVSRNLTELIKQHEAVSKGAVLTAGVAEADSDRAVVVLFVDQTITNTNSPQPRIDRNRMQMTLLHQDERWLVDDVKLL